MSYHFPPRPSTPVAPTQLSLYEQEGWILQPKLDGICGVFTIDSGRVTVFGRRGPQPISKWEPTEQFREELTSRLQGNYVLVGEIMCGRVTPKHLEHHPVVFHDVLVAEGKELFGTTLAERLPMLARLFPGQKVTTDSHHVETENIWRVRTYRTEFSKVYADLLRKRTWFPEYEGVVLKRPTAKLKPTHREGLNDAWQLKCRFPTATASF